MDDFDFLDFDIFGDDAQSEPSVAEITRAEQISDTAGYLTRSHNYWQQIPLPPELVLSGTNVLANLDDDTLLSMSPSLIAHVQRTEASGGLQVISPRTVTLGGIAARTAHTKRTTDMFLVGSSASRNTDWPVVSEPLAEHLFWHEPIDSYPTDPAARPRTVSAGLLPASEELSDPVARAFLSGRALVDLQRRPDVNGSPDQLAAVLSACWSIPTDAYEDLSEASLAPQGPLLRYAIRADDVYPMINAPIQARKCISVGASTGGRQLYGEDSAIDWRRMRVLAEAVFYQSSRLEGWTLTDMITPLLPGNPRSSPNRPGILQMRPRPGSVWTFDPRTFRLDITASAADVPGVQVPPRVLEAVVRFNADVRPVARASEGGARVSHSITLEHNVQPPTREALIAGYRAVVTSSAAFQARGKTSVAAVRGFVYESLADSAKLSSIRALWVARYMHETTEAMNYTHMLDLTTSRHVSARLNDLTSDMRSKLGVEAGRRGADLETWWGDLAAQLPQEIACMSEGSGSWALATAHMLLHPPTSKWSSLVRAMAYSSHSMLARGHLKDVRLPAEVGSQERSFQAGIAVARQLGQSYGAYYGAMYDVSCVLAARLRRSGNHVQAQSLMLAGAMWDIRSKVAGTVTLHADDGTSPAGGAFRTKHGSYHLTTAPYAAYHRWYRLMNDARFVRRDIKVMFPHHAPPRLSEVFFGKTEPLFVVPVGQGTRLMRYVNCPLQLYHDIESTLREIRDDVEAVMKFYDNEADDKPAHPDTVDRDWNKLEPLTLNLESFVPARGSYWSMIAAMDGLEAQDIVDAVCRMDNADAEGIESAVYGTEDELRAAVWRTVEMAKSAAAEARDAVV